MNAALAPHPTFHPVQRLTARECWLAAQCTALKELLIQAQTTITLREEANRAYERQRGADQERIAALLRRNQQLTTAMHRAACAG